MPAKTVIAVPHPVVAEVSPAMLRFALPLILALSVQLAGAGDAWAQQQAQQRERGQQGSQARPATDLSDSVRRVERRTGGRVLSVEQVPFDGRDVSRVKVMDDRGRVRVYMDDPRQARAERRSGSRRDDD